MRAISVLFFSSLLIVIQNQLIWPKDLVRRMVGKHKRLIRPQICYGCFSRKNLPLLNHHAPETPERLETKFYLFYNESMLNRPQVLDWNLSAALYEAFHSSHLKVLIHGFMGTWNGRRAFDGIKAYLKFPNYKVLSVDWQIGARGPIYTNAAANTELIGRQLGHLLFEMINKWSLDAENIHLIGFSLGAHIAGCASEHLKSRSIIIGRITGLDPAGPLFNHNLIKKITKKLDKTDARYVDIIHSDASLIFTDGFGIVNPVGHVDFFPNGGRQQPGCPDIKSSMNLNEDKACSHIRAWDLFYESILMQLRGDNCEFLAFKCMGDYKSFKKGDCFPNEKRNTFEFGKMGEVVSGYGPQYLITRSKAPFCGHQVRVSVFFDKMSTEMTILLVQGRFVFELQLNDNIVQFRIRLTNEETPVTKKIHGLVALRYGILHNVSIIQTKIRFELQSQNKSSESIQIPINKLVLEDLNGNQWSNNKMIIAGDYNKNFELVKNCCH